MKTITVLILWACAAGIVLAGYNPDMVIVQHPGNSADTNGRGCVKYIYRITDRNITNQAYALFLNSTDPAGKNQKGLYNEQMTSHPQGGILFDASAKTGAKYRARETLKDAPVRFVNWLDAARFSNWLNNGGRKGSSTEIGAYNLRKSAGKITRRENDAAFWIPSADELYKAAYFLLDGRWREPVLITGAENPLVRGVEKTAIQLVATAGKIHEIIDVSLPDATPFGINDSGMSIGSGAFEFAGSLGPLAESETIGFFIAASSDSDRDDERRTGDAIYAGAPENTAALLPISFGGSGGGSPPAGEDIEPIAALPPAS